MRPSQAGSRPMNTADHAFLRSPTPARGPLRLSRLRVLRSPLGCFATALLALALSPVPASAMCDVIPGAASEFRGAVGTLNRPFAIPGDEGEEIAIRVRPGVCDVTSPGIGDRDDDGAAEDDYFVSVLFEPTGAAPHHAVVLGTAGNLATCQARLASAPALANGGTAECQAVAAAGTCSGDGSACTADPECAPGICVALPGSSELSVRSECVGGSASGSRCTDDSECPGATCEPVVLSFRFPDTDDRVGTPTDDQTLTGPATIAVTPVSAPLPFALSSQASRCADSTGLVACIDELYARDGSCDTSAAAVDATFGHFTALPPANDYQALCTTATPGTPCQPRPPGERELRFTVDRAGNALIPMDYRGVLVVNDRIPIPRILGADSSIEAFTGGGVPVDVPSDAFLASYAPGGQKLPPIFTSLRGESPGATALFGSVDAPVGVIRVHRNRCVAGPQADEPCTATADCGVGGSCEALYDFSDRLALGVGPVLIASADFDAGTQETVALDGLLETPSMFAFVSSEAIDGVSLNVDSDATDPVLRLRDRTTGAVQPIGGSPGAEGRAVSRVSDGAFRFPAVAVEGDVVAFLEPEPLEGTCATPTACDKNADGDSFDTLLRAYRWDGSVPTPLGVGSQLAVAAEPLVDGRSVVVSNGVVFFRAREADSAEQQTTLESQEFNVSFGATGGALSDDGLALGLTSALTNAYVRDRQLGSNVRVDVADDGSGGSGFLPINITSEPALSADGRFAAFGSLASNLVPDDTNETCDVDGDGTSDENCFDYFVHDRDADGDGTFDEPGLGATSTIRVSVVTGGEQADNTDQLLGGQLMNGLSPSISADGRHVAFVTSLQDLDPTRPDQVGVYDCFVHDRLAQKTTLVNVDSDGQWQEVPTGTTGCLAPALSGDGRFVAFWTPSALVPGDTNGQFDVYVQDRDTDGDGTFDEAGAIAVERVSVASDGTEGNGHVLPFGITISADGRRVAFSSHADNLVAGDTNNLADVFVHDRATRTTLRASTGSDGSQAEIPPNNTTTDLGSLGGGLLSPEGHFVAFTSLSRGLVPGATSVSCDKNSDTQPDDCEQVFVKDLLTGLTQVVSLGSGGLAAGDYLRATGISRSTAHVAFTSNAENLVSGGAIGWQDVFVRGPAPAASAVFDVSGDGDVADTLLEVMDAATDQISPLCPALDVAVAGSVAAFLRPEAAGTSSTSACVQPSPDLNGDGDARDAIVHLWDGSSVANLRCAATDVALSATRVAALVSEADEGAGGTSLSGSPLGGDPGDTDKADRVLFVRAVGDPAPGSCVGSNWVNTGLAADSLAVSGDAVVIALPEAHQNGADRNGDGDAEDRVLRIYRAGTGALIPVDQAVEDFVADGNVVAFRTREARQGNTILNDDGDTLDDVLQAYDLVTGKCVSSQMAVTPCPVEACDPRFPYRVAGDMVTFVTLEADQREDLNGDGDETDLIKQVFNVRKAVGAAAPLECASFGAPSALEAGAPGAVTAIASASIGVCTTTGAACASDDDCGAGTCYVPPGSCIANLGTSCSCPNGVCSGCGSGEFCDSGTCFAVQGTCAAQSDCAGNAVCTDAQADLQRLFAPIATGAVAEGEVLVSSGRCVRECTSAADCEPGDSCDGATGTCTRERGSCRTRDDCEGGLACTSELPGKDELVTAAAADSDGDGLADPLDNCPSAAVTNPDGSITDDQADADGDGIGDLCDLATCGDGVLESGEACDDGNLASGDGCNASCVVEACSNGLDDDGDGVVDYGADLGCRSANDVSERGTATPGGWSLLCDNGTDDDGDGLVDYPSDPGCFSPAGTTESPACSDGLDNDEDGAIDHPADPQCKRPWDTSEGKTGAQCGLGFEVALLLPSLAWLRRRRAERRGSRSDRQALG